VSKEYGQALAAAFSANREVPPGSLTAWRAAIEQHLRPRPGLRVLDLGAGTGLWARALIDWFDVEVVCAEPAAAMRERAVVVRMLAGSAEHIPLPDASVDAAWLSTVVHHLPDLPAAAVELRRVVHRGGPVLVRSVFPGRCDRIGLFDYWPEALDVVAGWPTIQDVRHAFSRAGFVGSTLQAVPQMTAASMRECMSGFSRDAHTPLRLIDDDAYARGLARAEQAATQDSGPVVDELDLLVVR